jgi:FkbM family methyltransferase
MPAALDQIQVLLSEPAAEAAARESRAFLAQQAGTDGSVVIFGAGRLGGLCARALARAGVRLAAFCDNDPALAGKTREGALVLSPSEAAQKHGASALFVVAIWTGTGAGGMNDFLAGLRALGCRRVVPFPALLWRAGGPDLPFHAFDRPGTILAAAAKLRELAQRLADERSQEVLLAQLRQRLHGEFTSLPRPALQYFVPEAGPLRDDEIFVDGGAFDGDTLRTFLRETAGRFAEYHAFEPDPHNLAGLRATVAGLPAAERDRVFVHPVALAAVDGAVGFVTDAAPTSRRVERAGLEVPARALDSALAGRRVTFLKLDIEGGEAEALRGARRIVAEEGIVVAACVYHRPEDLWEIPAQLRVLQPKASFFLRQHGGDGWETVCYVNSRTAGRNE